MQPIYLDYNATTPVAPEVLEAMLPYFSEKFGNAASVTHPYGWVAKNAVEQATKQVANAIGCEKQQLVFTSGSTEAINLAIKGVWNLYSPRKGKHIVTCQTEHKAVLDTCAYLEKYHEANITYLSVDANGLINLDELKNAITEETILVSIMHSNNETGVIQPIAKIAEIVHEKESIFMSDCTQSLGKIPLNVDELGIDLCCVSAHKCYGPKGVGALFYRRRNPRVALQAQIHGGGHQNQLRSGTLPVPNIVGFGKAAELANKQQEQYFLKTLELRDYLESELKQQFGAIVMGEEANRLPNTSNIHFPNKDAAKLIEITNGAIAVSTGSACTSANLKASHVLKAMGFDVENGYSSIRFSLGAPTTKAEIEQTIKVLKERL